MRRRGVSWPRQERWIIEIDRPDRRDPVKIAMIQDGTQVILPAIRGDPDHRGQAFRGDSAWLENLSFILRNETSKTVACVALNVCFPETQSTGPMMCAPIQLGRIPETAAYSSEGQKLIQGPGRTLAFGGGEQMTISLNNYSESAKAFIEQRQPFSGITSCYLHLEMIYFDDGMKWTLGSYFLPDPKWRGSQKALAPTYFPGTP
jgi:hypothetical protein